MKARRTFVSCNSLGCNVHAPYYPFLANAQDFRGAILESKRWVQAVRHYASTHPYRSGAIVKQGHGTANSWKPLSVPNLFSLRMGRWHMGTTRGPLR